MSSARVLIGLCAVVLCTQGRAASPAKPDMSLLAASVDLNHDGKLTRNEWIGAGLPAQPFDNVAAGREHITAEDLAKSNIPPDLDENQDGKVTVDELIAYGRARAANPPKDRPLL